VAEHEYPYEAWIGLDLDGTLAEYHGWDDGKIGKPIPKMATRLHRWVMSGKNVRIVTARMAPSNDLEKMEADIRRWLRVHFNAEVAKIPITCCKDRGMIELWDDRAVQVIENTGERVDGKD